MGPYRQARDSYPDVTDVHPRLAAGLADVAGADERIYAALTRLLEAAAANGLEPMDHLMWSIGNRVLEVADAVVAAFRRWNVTAAAALIRLQVDSLLRLNLLELVHPCPPVVAALTIGEPLHRVADPTRPADLARPPAPGDDAAAPRHRLTDARLLELARRRHPWVERVYEESSRWVHLSDRHHEVSYRTTGTGLYGSVPIRPEMYPVDLLIDVLWAAKASGEAAAAHVEWWAGARGG